MSIHPINATTRLQGRYMDYLTSYFKINNYDLHEQFKHNLRLNNQFLKGPYLEATLPYKPGKTITELIDEQIVHPEISRFLPGGSEFRLYRHQERAIRLAKTKTSFVVATGTGSGKTESFMLPIFNHLLEQKQANILTDGVRALLLYPMNALANDQLDRLRKLLKDTPDITFGRFTGETEEKKINAAQAYKAQHKENPLPNERLSREEIRRNPPHILITNYAMLEYLMMRPEDNTLFSGVFKKNWRFVVLDEAHTYDGATGAEVAMLLRRLKTEVEENTPLQFIATSATLGSSDEAKREVMSFASKLFDQPFSLENEQLIMSERIDYDELYPAIELPDSNVYVELQKCYDQNQIPDLKHFGYLQTYSGQPRDIIYELLAQDRRLHALRKNLSEVHLLIDLANEIFPELVQQEAIERLIALIDIATLINDEARPKLLPAKYHTFFRALEGAYLEVHPCEKLHLFPKHESESGHPIYEMGVCRRCGEVHCFGHAPDAGRLLPKSKDGKQPNTIFSFQTTSELASDLEDDKTVVTSQKDWCPACGATRFSSEEDKPCECDVPLRRISTINVLEQSPSCMSCGLPSHRTDAIRRFYTGADGVTSALAAQLYQELVLGNPKQQPEQPIISRGDDWFMDEEPATPEDAKDSYETQNLIVFSDSRQDAAFFAPFLDRTYRNYLWRSYFWRAIQETAHPILIEEWKNRTLHLSGARSIHLFEDLTIDQEIKLRLFREFILSDDDFSLENLGMIAFDLRLEPQQKSQLETIISKQMQIKPEHAWSFLMTIFYYLRLQAIVGISKDLDRRHVLLAPKDHVYGIVATGGYPTAYVKNFVPERTNVFFQWFERYYDRYEIPYTSESIKSTLMDLFNRVLINPKSPLRKVFDYYDAEKTQSERWVLQANHFEVYIPERLYVCTLCKAIHTHDAGICKTRNCKGHLEQTTITSLEQGAHYREMYQHMLPIDMVVKEHTAQLSNRLGQEYQNQFINKDINVLSCSTTFEMGIDVGSLESVFMRNVPPKTSNYIQRAGRAGRSSSAAAFALTFAQKKSHDLTYFDNPKNMIAGDIKAPIFSIENEKIIRRHIHATALSLFFKESSHFYGNCERFYRFEDSGTKGHQEFISWLKEHPAHLKRQLLSIVPVTLQQDLGIDDWSWVNTVDDPSEAFHSASLQYETDVHNLNTIYNEQSAQRKRVDSYGKMIATLQGEPLIGYLSTKGFLPKYGFPVDTVEMKLLDPNYRSKLRLQRDLKLAISEYAPGSKLVANGMLIESTGVKLIEGKQLPVHHYTHCHNCNKYSYVGKYGVNDEREIDCEKCDEPLRVKYYAIPKFGFYGKAKPLSTERRPEKAYGSRVFFAEYDEKATPEQVHVEGNRYELDYTYSHYGTLSVVNDNKGKQYWICSTCGTQVEDKKKHSTPFGGTCHSKERMTVNHSPVSLGHQFTTDVLRLSFRFANASRLYDSNKSYSLLFALIRSASFLLQINEDNLGGVIHYEASTATYDLILYDDVPGGAGFVQAVSRKLPEIMDHVRTSIQHCTCDVKTSCYTCLRSYRNQFLHDQLQRQHVIDLFSIN